MVIELKSSKSREPATSMAAAVGVTPSKPSLQRPPPSPPLPLALPPPSSGDAQSDDPPSHSHSQEVVMKRKRRSNEDGNGSDEDDLSKSNLYECRFCNMRFAKSQALGGHMNRHRQEREKEQFQHAQQLVSSMSQQNLPRNWNSMASELSASGGAGAAALARLNSQLTGGAPRPEGGRPQLPPQISFNSSRMPISSTSSPPNPSSPSNYYLPSNSSSNNLQNLQWNIDGGFNSNSTAMPRSASSQGFSSMDTGLVGGGLRDDFLSGVLQPRQDAGNFGGPQFSGMPPLISRGLGATGGSSFQEVQGGSGSAGLPFGHDNPKSTALDTHGGYMQQPQMRMNDALLRQLACSSPLNSSLMQSNTTNDLSKPPCNSFPGLRAPPNSHTFLVQCNNVVQFNQHQPMTRPSDKPDNLVSLPRQFGNSASGQYHVTSPSSLFSGQSLSNNYAPLPPSHEYSNSFQDFENNMPGMGLYSVPRPTLVPTSSGSAASGSFAVSAGWNQDGVKIQSEDASYNQLRLNQNQQDAVGPPQGSSQGNLLQTGGQKVPNTLVEVVDGNQCESMNITSVDSGDVSGMSVPARYQSTDFSSGSPEWRSEPLKTSPNGHANQASPASDDYCSG